MNNFPKAKEKGRAELTTISAANSSSIHQDAIDMYICFENAVTFIQKAVAPAYGRDFCNCLGEATSPAYAGDLTDSTQEKNTSPRITEGQTYTIAIQDPSVEAGTTIAKETDLKERTERIATEVTEASWVMEVILGTALVHSHTKITQQRKMQKFYTILQLTPIFLRTLQAPQFPSPM